MKEKVDLNIRAPNKKIKDPKTKDLKCLINVAETFNIVTEVI